VTPTCATRPALCDLFDALYFASSPFQPLAQRVNMAPSRRQQLRRPTLLVSRLIWRLSIQTAEVSIRRFYLGVW
jgi:hypothetical protein